MNTKMLNKIFKHNHTYSNYEICMINLGFIGIGLWVFILIKLIIQL